MTLISVDFPAPFSPISACTSPSSSSKDTFFKARTPANDLVIDLAFSSGTAIRLTQKCVLKTAVDRDDVAGCFRALIARQPDDGERAVLRGYGPSRERSLGVMAH